MTRELATASVQLPRWDVKLPHVWARSLGSAFLAVCVGFGCRAPAEPSAAPTAGEARADRGETYGWVRTRAVDLRGVRLGLGVARRCRARVSRSDDTLVLRQSHVLAGRCRLGRYDGLLSLTGDTAAGQRHILAPLRVVDGRVELRFAVLDQQLRTAGFSEGLDTFTSVALGRDGWAGRINVHALRTFLARWHYDWVERGRGVPALFVARNPGDRLADPAASMAVESEIARQERDLRRVEDGTMTPEAFLERHVWSPYQASVRDLARSRTAGANGANDGNPD